MEIDKKQSILDVLLNIDARISHIEDICADNRRVILKLVKQGNSIVNFLKELDIEAVNDVELEYDSIESPLLQDLSRPTKNKMSLDIDELVDKFLSKKKDLEELEKELRKNKDDITPGIIGES